MQLLKEKYGFIFCVSSFAFLGGCILGAETFQLGVDVFKPDILYQITGKKSPTLAVVTNQTGRSQDGKRTINVLRQHGCKVKKVFAPEHGFNGQLAADCDVKDSCDVETGIPVISLYGKRSSINVKKHLSKGIECIIFDMQDAGIRHYSYLSTLFYILKIAAAYHIPCVVFDRPNPLKHLVEGPLVEASHVSSVAIASIPLRYGLTIGEVARYFNTYCLKAPAQLHVVAMRNFVRSDGITAMPAPLSPYIRNKQACYGYSFLGLLGEVRPFDTGLDTAHAFRCFALPDAVSCTPRMWEKLSERLHAIGLSTRLFRYKSPRKKAWCQGLRLVAVDPSRFSSCHVLITIMRFMKDAGVSLTFSPNFNASAGTDQLASYIQKSNLHDVFACNIHKGLVDFCAKAKKIALYGPDLKIVDLQR